MNPFKYLNSITYTKEYMFDDVEQAEKEYVPFLVNRGLSYFQDTLLLANLINIKVTTSKKAHFDFLFHIVRKKRRFSKWSKKIQDDNLDLIMKHYNYNRLKASQVLPLFNDKQLEKIRNMYGEQNV